MIYVLVFIAVALASFVWAKYIANVANKSRFKAASWDAILIGITAGYTIAYTSDPWNVLPAMLGGFIGTYSGVKK